jgi:hypothetical protein
VLVPAQQQRHHRGAPLHRLKPSQTAKHHTPLGTEARARRGLHRLRTPFIWTRPARDGYSLW